ncbi:MAG: hypothetical protein BGN86_07690 [Caulobacterales bacterium 68-7]|nr:MAG: hypothetical protein BGN86_07690 [Caulobacterales bacterium 68-7]
MALLAVVCLIGGPQPGRAQGRAAQLAQPIDPVVGILDAFKTHDVVALDEGNHNNEQGAAFREKLYRDPRFQEAVSTIVVESGNGRYQAMMDRYIDGEDVPEKELRKAWLETMGLGTAWDVPIYAEMFQTIRDINRRLPKARRLRVLLGDVPYFAEQGDALRTDAFPAGLVRDEVLDKRHKVLIVYGGVHLLRHSAAQPIGPPGTPLAPPGSSDTIVTILEKAGVKVFSIWTHARYGEDLTALQPDITGWPRPSLSVIKDTTLGLAPFNFYQPMGSGMMIVNGVRTLLGGDSPWTMQDQFDAVLYLGPKSDITYSKLSASLCSDPEYVAMRAGRMGDLKTLDGRLVSDDFKAQCAAIVAGR